MIILKITGEALIVQVLLVPSAEKDTCRKKL